MTPVTITEIISLNRTETVYVQNIITVTIETSNAISTPLQIIDTVGTFQEAHKLAKRLQLFNKGSFRTYITIDQFFLLLKYS